jgi:RimJ/RimL family protein N-acetyltransferase
MGIVRLRAHVRADNRRARRAYEKAGFRSVGQDGMRGEQLRYELVILP